MYDRVLLLKDQVDPHFYGVLTEYLCKFSVCLFLSSVKNLDKNISDGVVWFSQYFFFSKKKQQNIHL